MSFWRRIAAFAVAVLSDLWASARALMRFTETDFLVLVVTTVVLTIELWSSGFQDGAVAMSVMGVFFCAVDFAHYMTRKG